jgi:hypothetical protein
METITCSFWKPYRHGTENLVTNWELGVKRPESDTLAQRFHALDTSADEFIGLPNRVESLAFEERVHLRRFRTLAKYERMSLDRLPVVHSGLFLPGPKFSKGYG